MYIYPESKITVGNITVSALGVHDVVHFIVITSALHVNKGVTFRLSISTVS